MSPGQDAKVVNVLSFAGFAITTVGCALDALLPLYFSTALGLSAVDWSKAVSNRSLGTITAMIFVPVLVRAFGIKNVAVYCSAMIALIVPLTILLPIDFLFITLPATAGLMSSTLVGVIPRV